MRLDSLGFCWDPRSEQWEDAFTELMRFRNRKGHCRVPQDLVQGGQQLGTWVSTQRCTKHLLSEARIDRLNSIGFSWDPLNERWDESIAALKEYIDREGHCRVERNTILNGIKLGAWVKTLRLYKDNLPAERIRELEALGLSWDPVAQKWEDNFTELQKFKMAEGHCVVPRHFLSLGLKLGVWVKWIRHNKDNLTPDQRRRLDSLGFAWNPHTAIWEESFSRLKEFRDREGHCRTPRRHKEKAVGLGSWVSKQRKMKGKLTAEQVSRLDSIGFIWKP